MFNPEHVLSRLEQQPFCPFFVVASGGLKYEITHPDLVLVGDRYLTIGYDDPKRPGIFNREVRVALMHVICLEEIPVEEAAA